MNSQDFKKINLPDKPGVYFFKLSGKIIYIGKATSLKERVKSYFAKDLIETRGQAILDMVFKSDEILYTETDTALEALLLESQLIKKYQPKYNTKEKDNKSFNYVIITKEAVPKVLLVRGRTLKIHEELDKLKYQYLFGPFTSGGAIREGLKIIRRIFPYIDQNSIQKDRYEFYRQLGLTPDTSNTLFTKQYKKNIKNIILFFQGKKKQILLELRKEMSLYAKKLEFEKAGEVKRQIFALEHINDVAILKDDFFDTKSSSTDIRIESYDIAHMSGQNMVGVMTVVTNGIVDKSEYKKFIIKTQKNSNDTGALYEVLMRRFKHTEWGIPDLVVIDGGKAQLSIVKQVLNFYQLNIPFVSVLKDEHHKAKEILGDTHFGVMYKKEIILSNSEAHRFAITFHKEKRAKNFLAKKIVRK